MSWHDEIAVFARPASREAGCRYIRAGAGVSLPARCNRVLSTAERSDAVSLSCGDGMRPDLRPAPAVSLPLLPRTYALQQSSPVLHFNDT